MTWPLRMWPPTAHCDWVMYSYAERTSGKTEVDEMGVKHATGFYTVYNISAPDIRGDDDDDGRDNNDDGTGDGDNDDDGDDDDYDDGGDN